MMDIEIKSPFPESMGWPTWLPIVGETVATVFDEPECCVFPCDFFCPELEIVRDLALAGF